ncbi:MAG: DUF3565 domain-containing protein [Gammaproteobacteria bacterium]|nr:DUF3565 domain-containing protein [Gammaproteobacteria bacterium]
MRQPIVDFDRDEAGDWRAILACGHRQHLRGLLSNLVYGGLIRRRPC